MQKSIFAAMQKRVSFAETLRAPVFAPLMQQRVLVRTICGAAAAHLVLAALGFSLWHCPIREVLHVPCPGCGLTRAVMLLLRGHFRESLQMHAYAPLLVSGLILLMLSALLPREYSRRLIELVARVEKRASPGAIALVLFPIYWIVRLIFHVAPA